LPALNSDETVGKVLGFVFFVSGGLMLSFAGGRYVVGIAQADQARTAWEEAEAHGAVAHARAVARHHVQSAPVAGSPIGRLVIPHIDLDEIMLEGVDPDNLNAGPGHLPGSPLPGDRGNAIVSAHRDRHFNHFDALTVGDTVVTETTVGRTTWVIVSQRVVDKNDPALFRTSDATLTLTTCWPIQYVGAAPSRLIVTAKPVVPAPTRVASTN
jgi:LPXTG-site transpeptidase (sortase) family protein